MSEENIALKILTQTSENIQKLFDLTTRIDERIKSISVKQQELETQIHDLTESHTEVLQNIAVLESKDISDVIQYKCPYRSNFEGLQKEIAGIDKRLCVVEIASTGNQDRWKKVTDFFIQLIWITLAAWVLYKLNLSPPSVP